MGFVEWETVRHLWCHFRPSTPTFSLSSYFSWGRSKHAGPSRTFACHIMKRDWKDKLAVTLYFRIFKWIFALRRISGNRKIWAPFSPLSFSLSLSLDIWVIIFLCLIMLYFFSNSWYPLKHGLDSGIASAPLNQLHEFISWAEQSALTVSATPRSLRHSTIAIAMEFTMAQLQYSVCSP